MTLDRTGEPLDPDTDPRPLCICDGSKAGFADYDGEHPRPCPRHKPGLLPSRRRERLWGASDPGPDRPHQPGPAKPAETKCQETDR